MTGKAKEIRHILDMIEAQEWVKDKIIAVPEEETQ